MMVRKSIAHLIVSVAILLPRCWAQHESLAIVRDEFKQLNRRRLSKDKEIEYTSYPTQTYTSYPTSTPTRYPTGTIKPSSPAPATSEPTVATPETSPPTLINVVFVSSPTALPATSFPTNSPISLSPQASVPIDTPAMNEVIPLFDNDITSTRVLLMEFDITIESAVDRSFNPDAVADIYKREVRQSLQQYFHRNLGLGNILLVQLQEVVPTNRRSLVQIQETFRYDGRVDFRDGAPSVAELHERQAAVMADLSVVQTFLNSENEYLQNVNVTDLRIVPVDVRPASTNSPNDDDVSFIVIIAVSSGVALAISFLLCVLVCRLCRAPPPPPLPPVTKKKGSRKGGSKMDTSITSTSSAEHLQLALSESTAAVTVVTEPEKKGKNRLSSVIEKKDSEDSMDGFSLGSGGMYGRSKQVKPSWMRPLKRSSPVPEYNSDNESQFSYEQVAGKTEETSALGPTLSSDFESDEELAVPASPVVTKGYVPSNTPDKTLDSISPMPSRYTKGLDMGKEETPFDEAIDDSMDQSFDAFHVELAKFNNAVIPDNAARV